MQTVWRRGYQRTTRMLDTPERPRHQALTLRDPIAIAACLGAGDAFDRSVTDFSQRYADQNERDY